MLRQKYLEKYVQIVNRNIQKDVYKGYNLTKLNNEIQIGKDKSLQIDDDLKEQMEYESFATITSEEIQKKEEAKLLKNINKNKLYEMYNNISYYAKLAISNLKGGVNMNNILDDFFKVGIYNFINSASKAYQAFRIEFANYKQDIGLFPTRGDYFQLFYYKELNQNKVYNFKDQLRERINQSINLYNYVVRDKLTNTRVNINWINPEHIDVNPTYKINGYLMDFLTFTVICCVPFKLVRFRGKFNQLIMQLRNQKARFQ